MKKTIYELLGMIKDGKTPKKIKYQNRIYEYYNGDYREEFNSGYDSNWLFANEIIDLTNLNDVVEILEEPKGIPEKLPNNFHYTGEEEVLADKINEIIDTLEMLNDKIKWRNMETN